MALSGSLSEISLADIIQLIGNMGKTGRIKLVRDNETGYIYFSNGKLVHAELESENLTGESAIYRLASWKEGDFSFEVDQKPEKVTIKRPFATILMEAVRIMDEWELIRKKISSEKVIPYFKDIDPENQRRITLNTKEWFVLSKIDGKKSIKEIAFESKMSIYEVAKIFYGLSVNDLIEFKPPTES